MSRNENNEKKIQNDDKSGSSDIPNERSKSLNRADDDYGIKILWSSDISSTDRDNKSPAVCSTGKRASSSTHPFSSQTKSMKTE